LGGNTTLNLVIPSLPGSATISGKVTDSSAKGIANVVVSAYSESIKDAAHVGFSAFGTTNADGNYSITVLSGTSYQPIFVPPVPSK